MKEKMSCKALYDGLRTVVSNGVLDNMNNPAFKSTDAGKLPFSSNEFST